MVPVAVPVDCAVPLGVALGSAEPKMATLRMYHTPVLENVDEVPVKPVVPAGWKARSAKHTCPLLPARDGLAATVLVRSSV